MEKSARVHLRINKDDKKEFTAAALKAGMKLSAWLISLGYAAIGKVKQQRVFISEPQSSIKMSARENPEPFTPREPEKKHRASKEEKTFNTRLKGEWKP